MAYLFYIRIIFKTEGGMLSFCNSYRAEGNLQGVDLHQK